MATHAREKGDKLEYVAISLPWRYLPMKVRLISTV